MDKLKRMPKPGKRKKPPQPDDLSSLREIDPFTYRGRVRLAGVGIAGDDVVLFHDRDGSWTVSLLEVDGQVMWTKQRFYL